MYLSSCQAASWCLELLKTIRSEPPRNVNALPTGPEGSGATPTFLRAAADQVSSSLRGTVASTHGPPIQTASLPPLNWFSTCVPSHSSIDLSKSPEVIRLPMNSTPCWDSGELMVDLLASAESSAPPASHTNGITLWTRS